MNRLIEQLQRLHFSSGSALTPELVAAHLAGDLALPLAHGEANGSVRVLVIDFRRAADWPQVLQLHRCLQEELGLPAPAIAVTGGAGFQLWLSLAEAQPLAQAERFLAGLSRRYLAELAVGTAACHPAGGEASTAAGIRAKRAKKQVSGATGEDEVEEVEGVEGVPEVAGVAPGGAVLVPALDRVSGRWSAFIDPGLGSMFIDEAGLATPPNLDAQADLLARLQRITTADFAAALKLLDSPANAAGDGEAAAGVVSADTVATARGKRDEARARLAIGGGFTDPTRFLLAVMNDPSASAKQRIRAAKALLPYFARG